MISVIILTRHRSYKVLDVPSNGKLIIKEEHLICGIVQNGVRMVPYGNLLTPFESFIWENTLSVEMLPANVFHPDYRVLDFTNIELLQGSTTIHPSQSGSTEGFTPPTYTEGGLEVNYNLMVKGLDFANFTEVQDFFRYNAPNNIICNGIANLESGHQKLSLHNWYGRFKQGQFTGTPVTEVYDIGLNVTDLHNLTIQGATELEILDLPNCTYFDHNAVYNQKLVSLKLLKLHSLPFFGVGPENNGTFTSAKYPNGLQIEVPRSMETVNSGALEGDLQSAIDAGLTPNIVFID